MNDEILAWFQKLYPNGIVDWKTEYARLLEVCEQLMNTKISGKVAEDVFKTAIECGKMLLENDKK